MLLAALPAVLGAQVPAADSSRVLVFERQFGPGPAAPFTVHLERRVVYKVELSGPGTPVFEPADGGAPAFLVLLAGDSTDLTRHYEMQARRTGPHAVRVDGLPGQDVAVLRLYVDSSETGRIATKRERTVAVGGTVAAGAHTGYRLDPTGGNDPSGGGDWEGCLQIDTGPMFATCVGAGRQMFPDHAFDVTWLFIEERVRVAGGRLLAGRQTDFGLALRFSQALGAGPRSLDPVQLGIGAYTRQHLSPGTRRGWSVAITGLYGLLGSSVETEFRDSFRLTAGVTWVP